MKKILTGLFLGGLLTFLVPVRPVNALFDCIPGGPVVVCNNTEYLSSGDKPPDQGYAPTNGTSCGCSLDTNGKSVQDCYNSSEKRCHQPVVRSNISPSCPAGYDNYVNNPALIGVGGNQAAFYKDSCEQNADIKSAPCCQLGTALGVIQQCATKSTPVFLPGGNFCQQIYDNLVSTTQATTCNPPNFYRPGSGCVTAANAGWLSHLSSCGGKEGVSTGIGCIPTSDLTATLTFLFKWALGASGGILLIMIIITGYNLMTSAGDQQKLQSVKENLVSIFSGLILIGFSLVLLQTIGANILGLPTF